MAPLAWTDEDKTRLRELRAQGQTASEIGRELGRTRNAIIGMLHRLDVASPSAAATVRPHKHRRKKDKAKKRPAPRGFIFGASHWLGGGLAEPTFLATAPIIVPDGPVGIMALRSHHCRNVLDERGADGLALYCGRTRLAPRPYCGDCLKVLKLT